MLSSRFPRCLLRSHSLSLHNQRPKKTTTNVTLSTHYHRSAAAASSASSSSDANNQNQDGYNNNTNDPSSTPTSSSVKHRKDIFPGIQRIILIRHGESLGNIDERAYVTTADWRIPLTERGREQARSAGRKVASQLCYGSLKGSDSEKHDVVRDDDDDDAGQDGSSGPDSKTRKGKIFFYFSPYLRTRQTLREILREIDPECIVGIREDPRIAEQQFGNFQSHHSIQDNKATRSDFGRFFYRFPDGGESGFDVYNRVSGFIGTLRRDSDDLLDSGPSSSSSSPSSSASSTLEDDGMTICIITHGLSLRLFLMRWFQYSVHEFERSYNPKNGRVVVLKPSQDGGFKLSEVDRIAMGFPLYKKQERFRLMDDYSLLDKTRW